MCRDGGITDGSSAGGAGLGGASGGGGDTVGPAGASGAAGAGGATVASVCSRAPTDCLAAPASGDFTCYEELGYCRFLVGSYPRGLRDPSWGGVYSTLTPDLLCEGDPACADHRVCSESTSLLALLAASRGDRTTFDQMLAIWFDPKKHYSAKNRLAHWVLDASGAKLAEPIPNGGGVSGYLNASGEELRMFLALLQAGDTFDTVGGSASRDKAVELGTSIKDKLFGAAADAAPFLLRPWRVWGTDVDESPLAFPPDRVSLNVIVPLAYYRAAMTTWLPQELRDHFAMVLEPTLSAILGCAKGGLFQPQYVLSASACADEDGAPGGCQVLACGDIAARLADYANAAGAPADPRARATLDFLETKYRQDGVLWNAYGFVDGQPLTSGGATPQASLVNYVFLAKLAMSFGRWDLAEKIFIEQIIPNQVFAGNGHPSAARGEAIGGFKPRLAAVTSCWNDAQAFPNLEAVNALHIWNTAQKSGWTSAYPKWVTVPPMASTGGTDTVELSGVVTRYVRILLTKRGGSWGNYSLYEIEAWGADGPLEIKSAAASSVEWDIPAGRAWTADLAVDGKRAADSRWSSSKDGSDPQWIYIDLGAKKSVSKVVITWENAYASEYEVQWGDTP